MKICLTCKIEKPFIEFHKDKTRKFGVKASCKKCACIRTNQLRLENEEHYVQVAHKYYNSENGFLKGKIRSIFSKQNIERTGISNANKKNIEKYFYEYVKKHGKNCFYCFEPWTYVTKKIEIGVGRHIKRTKRMNLKNLSFDRLDNSKPYNVDNIIFCCQKCNMSKRDMSISLIKRLHEIITERNL